MKNKLFAISLIFFFILSICSCKKDKDELKSNSVFFDHTCTNLSDIPVEWINKAKTDLHIAYGHTSHGSQLTEGMSVLEERIGQPYLWNEGTLAGSLDLDDYAMDGDLGNPDRTTWESLTRTYLGANPDVNVIIWSWCGQVSTATEGDINTYLGLMSGLEEDYPNVKFVYMTGHLDGSGLGGQLNIRNEQIRKYCKDNGKTLYDFADIESYDPDGNYYLDKAANDNCDYDSDGNGTRDKNWAIVWQSSHTEGVDWFNSDPLPQHTQALNGNRKAYAAWWLWARLAGWDGK